MQNAPMLIGVLVTFNRPEVVVDTVAKIAAQSCALNHLYVVDNSTLPSDAENFCRAVWAGTGARLTWISLPENRGPAGGYELGMRRAVRESGAGCNTWIALFDDDDPPPSQTVLEELMRSVEASGADAVGALGSVLNRRTGVLHRPSFDGSQFADVDQIGNGRFPVYRSTALEDVGFMRGELFFGWEELDLAQRLKSKGYRVCIDQDLRSKYEKAMGKRSRGADLTAAVQARSELRSGARVNHLRILRTHVGIVTMLVAWLQLIGADLVRLGAAARTRSFSAGLANVMDTVRALVRATQRGPVR